MTTTTASLREHLVTSLSTLPNPHKLDLTILSSEPKRTSSIFPHTHIPPKCFQQEFMVVLSSDLPQPPVPATALPGNRSQPADASSTISAAPANQPSTPSSSTPRVLVSAISAYLYTFPSTQSSGTAAILYISKLDSSGYSPAPLPLTRSLIEAFMAYFLLPVHAFTEVRIQLFARAQRQYLFPNSSNGGGKKVLTGTGLSKWWKGVYEDVASGHHKRAPGDQRGDASGQEEITLRYLLPGYDEGEARILLGQGRGLPPGMEWKYEPPFTLPLHASHDSNRALERNSTSSLSPGSGSDQQASSGHDGGPNGASSKYHPPSLATLIPSLPDDPKTRFLEELVTDAFSTSTNPSVASHAKRQPDLSSTPSHDEGTVAPASAPAPEQEGKKSKRERDKLGEEKIRREAHLALAKVQVTEFWERIGFRQECSSGDVTGFFTLELRRAAAHSPKGEKHFPAQGEDVPKEVTHGVQDAAPAPVEVNSLDPESTAVSGLSSSDNPGTQAATTSPPSSSGISMAQVAAAAAVPGSTSSEHSRPADPSPSRLHLRQEILDRLLVALTNVDFADLPLALEGTEIWLTQASSIVRGEIGENWLGCQGSIPAKKGLAAESAGHAEKRERKEEVVTMLQPKKKKKKV